VQIELATIDRIPVVWDACMKFMRGYISQPESMFTEHGLRVDIEAGRKQLWLIHDGKEPFASLVTEILESGDRRICAVLLLSGTAMERWLGLQSTIAAWARDHGCVALRIHGREGWERVLKEWRKVGVIMEKAI